MSLFQECVDALKKEVILYDDETSFKIFENFEDKISFTFYGRIDWSNFSKFFKLNNLDGIRNYIDFTDNCYVLWNDESLPVLQTSIESVYLNVDDVLAVSYDTCLYVFEKNIIIEFYHDGEITLGVIGG